MIYGDTQTPAPSETDQQEEQELSRKNLVT